MNFVSSTWKRTLNEKFQLGDNCKERNHIRTWGSYSHNFLWKAMGNKSLLFTDLGETPRAYFCSSPAYCTLTCRRHHAHSSSSLQTETFWAYGVFYSWCPKTRTAFMINLLNVDRKGRGKRKGGKGGNYVEKSWGETVSRLYM